GEHEPHEGCPDETEGDDQASRAGVPARLRRLPLRRCRAGALLIDGFPNGAAHEATLQRPGEPASTDRRRTALASGDSAGADGEPVWTCAPAPSRCTLRPWASLPRSALAPPTRTSKPSRREWLPS